MKPWQIAVYGASAVVGLWAGTQAATPPAPTVGTFQIACADGGRSTIDRPNIVCKIIDTRTGRVVDSN